ncbi:MAG: DUF2878 family protein [Gammaproteobacteria bacterium]|nr:DUF2878 family protein [Gammaproteobacteria bacterium]
MLSRKISNFVLFQIGWFACVLSGAAMQPLMGVAIAAAIIGWHVWRAQQPAKEIYLILAAMLVGALWDSLLVWQTWLDYPAGILLPHTAPYWIIIMWALFASTLNLSLRWLKSHLLLAVILGAIAGPLAYYAGARLGAVDFVQPTSAFIALALGWAVFTPLLVILSKRFDGYALLARGHD